MITFNTSAEKTLNLAADIAVEVSDKLSKLDGKNRFNVKQYSEELAAKHGYDELFVATLVRTIVNGCDEYTSQRGRNGGVGRTTPEDLAKKAAQSTKAQEPSAPAVTDAPAAESEVTDEPDAQVSDQEDASELPPVLTETTLSDDAAPANSDEDDLDFLDGLVAQSV